MREIALTDVPGWLAEAITQAKAAHEPLYLTQGGQRVAAVVDAASMEHLSAPAREERDVAAIPIDDRDKGDLGL